jgi:hypothetical protein
MRETISNSWRIDDMFGLDQLFDFNGNGKLDAFERACEMTFLYNAEEASGKPDRRYGDHTGFDKYGSEKDDNDWEDN